MPSDTARLAPGAARSDALTPAGKGRVCLVV